MTARSFAAFTVTRLARAIPLLLCVASLAFFLVELAPGDSSTKYFSPSMLPEVREAIFLKHGLDKPLFVRYLLALRNLATLDLGVSLAQERPVVEVIADYLPATLLLSSLTLTVLFPSGVALGVAQAMRRGAPIDFLASVLSLFVYSMPHFWLALMLQVAFGYRWADLPVSGMRDTMADFMGTTERIVDLVRHLVLPALAMGLAGASGVARYVRASILEELDTDYVRTARAKGLSERRVVFRHALRNALLPVVTLLGLSLPSLFAGSVLVEVVFGWPGMGRLIYDSIYAQDTPVIMGCFLVYTALVVAGNTFADLAYAVVDPRIAPP